ncbi:MAG: trypsin-like peptidase domain-containing protein [Chloroflexi bacterium]|nr:trypsin-like peptidase domain-containing protein [Chloroflexota bacterium]
MTNQRDIDAALYDLQHGNTEKARERLRIIVRTPSNPREWRAQAWITLADSFFTSAEKRACLTMAMELDPQNPDAYKRLGRLAMPPPPGMAPPKPTAPLVASLRASKSVLAGYFPTIGVFDGPNGAGTGFFVTPSGLVATTRNVIGGCLTVTLELAPGQRAQGTVVWSSAVLDLALIDTPYTVGSLLNLAPSVAVLPDQYLTAHTYAQSPIHGRGRPYTQQMPEGWFATDMEAVWDAGGGPITNKDNAVVGMLTRNCTRKSPAVFGLSLGVIQAQAQRAESRLSDALPRRYCPSCGQTAWGELNAVYCHHCGASFSEDWMR